MGTLIKSAPFGKTKDGKDVTIYRIGNSKGSYVDVLDYGVTIVGFNTRTREGDLVDIVSSYNEFSKYEVSSLGKIVVEGDIKQDFQKEVWDVAEIGDNYISFFIHSDDRNLNIACKVRFMEFDRLVFDYSSSISDNEKINVSHNLTFHLGSDDTDKLKIRAFTPKCIVDGNLLETEKSGFDGKNYNALNDEQELVLFDDKSIIHPFAEILFEGNELTLSTYSTMDVNKLKCTNRGICSTMSFKDIPLREKDEPFTYRTVYGVDLKFREGQAVLNPMMFFNGNNK